MSFRSLSRLFRSNRKISKTSSEDIPLPIEGYEKCIQLLLAYVGQDVFEFNMKAKDDPDSHCDGNQHIHGTAVLRYLGKCHGLSGSDPFEDLEIDQIVEVLNEFRYKLSTLEREEDQDLRERNLKRFSESEALKYLRKFDAVIAANKGHLALSKVTWADFLVAGLWNHIRDTLKIDCDTKYVNINNLVNNIMSIPSIKLMVESQRDTPSCSSDHNDSYTVRCRALSQ